MTIYTKLKYRDIICSMILEGIYTITFKINGSKVRVSVAQLLRDNVAGSNASTKGDVKLAKMIMKKLMRTFTETDGLPYGYDCNISKLLNRSDVYFVEREAVNPMARSLMLNARDEGYYLHPYMIRKVIQFVNIGKLGLDMGKAMNVARASMHDASGALSHIIGGAVKNIVAQIGGVGVSHIISDTAISRRELMKEEDNDDN